MKKEIIKVVSTLLAVSLTASIFVSCGRTVKEAEDSLIPSETYTNAKVQEPESAEEDAIIQEVLGEEKWDGDYSKLADEQKADIEKALRKKGYTAKVTDEGIVYYDYVPTPDDEEIAEVVEKVLGVEKWDGNYEAIPPKEKKAVQEMLNDRGYDVDIGVHGFVFKGEADRKEETTSPYYNQLPSKEQIAAAVSAVIGTEGFKNWNGKLLSLDENQRKGVLKLLNNYGFDLGINDKGALYMVHAPSNTVTYDTAYTASPIGGTTQAPTTIKTEGESEKDETTVNMTGTTAKEEQAAAKAESVYLSTFGGTEGDSFEDIVATKDGGYAILSRFHSTDGDFADSDKSWTLNRMAVVKVDKNGKVLWKRYVGSKKVSGMNVGVFGEALTELADGSIVAVGHTDSTELGAQKGVSNLDALMVKYDKDGNQQWLKLISGKKADFFHAVAATPDGGFVVGGHTISSDGDFAGLDADVFHAVLIQYNAAGEKQWMQSYAGGTNAAQFTEIAVTEQGAIYAICHSPVAVGSKAQMDMAVMAGRGGNDGIVMKFTSGGELIKYVALAGSSHDMANCLTLSNEGGVVVGGVWYNNTHDDSVFHGKTHYNLDSPKADAYVISLDEYLNVRWVKTFGGVGTDEVSGVVAVKGGYAVVGHTDSKDNDFRYMSGNTADGFLFMISENGTDVTKYDLASDGAVMVKAIAATSNKKFTLVGSTRGSTNHFVGQKPAALENAVAFMEMYTVQ